MGSRGWRVECGVWGVECGGWSVGGGVWRAKGESRMLKEGER